MAGISRQALVEILAGRSIPTEATFTGLCEAVGASRDEILLDNVGDQVRKMREILGAPDAATIFAQFLSELSPLQEGSVSLNDPGLQSGIEQLRRSLAVPSFDDEAGRSIAIPALTAKASAGDGSLLWGQELGDGPFRFMEDWLRREFGTIANLRLIQIQGDSQLPDLNDGDLAIIDTSKNKLENGLAVIRLDECLMIKRLQREGHFVQLISRNPMYAPTAIDLSKEEDRIRGIGKVVYIFKSV